MSIFLNRCMRWGETKLPSVDDDVIICRVLELQPIAAPTRGTHFLSGKKNPKIDSMSAVSFTANVRGTPVVARQRNNGKALSLSLPLPPVLSSSPHLVDVLYFFSPPSSILCEGLTRSLQQRCRDELVFLTLRWILPRYHFRVSSRPPRDARQRGHDVRGWHRATL